MIHVELPIADIRCCARNREFVEAVGQAYADLDHEIASHAPVCINRGVCCKFESYGHNLFATSVELAFFLAHIDGPLRAPVDRSHCTYQVDGKCTARTGRPAGCRIFFCDPNSQAWQPQLMERTLHRLAEIGARFGLPYAYLEWTDALRSLAGEVGQAGDAPDAQPEGSSPGFNTAGPFDTCD